MTALITALITALGKRSIGNGHLWRRVPIALALAVAGWPELAWGQFVYSVESGNGVSAYTLDSKTRALAAVPGSPFTTGVTSAGMGLAVAVDPQSRFVYAVNAGSNDVSAYMIDAATGSLAPLPNSPFGAGRAPSGVAADPKGRFVYVANSGSGDVSAYRVDATARALIRVPGSPFAAGALPGGVAVDPRGKFLYVTDTGSGNILAYVIDAITGALTPVKGSPYLAARNIGDVTIDPTGRFLYLPSADTTRGSVWAFAINANSGELTPVPNSPFTAEEDGPLSVAVDPAGKFAYVASTGDMAVYSLDDLTGALKLTPGSRLRWSGMAHSIYSLSRALLPIPKPPFLASLQPHRIAVAGLPALENSAPLGTALVTSFTAGPLRNNFTGGFGMQFTVGATPLNVSALGRIYISGSNGTHVVKLVSVSDGTDVPGGSVTISLPSGIAGQFAYQPLAAPVTLAPNTAYYLISAETSGGDPFYDLGPVTAGSVVSVNSGVVDWPGNGLFPIGPANNSYVPVNLLYQPAGPPPTVAITSPVGGATVSGSSVPVMATATAAGGLIVTSVQFQIDNVNYGPPVSTSPYSITLDTTKLTNGTHTLTAVATDSASDTNTSAPVVITVSNRATSVSITTPADGSPVSGSRVVVSASATPATGLTVAGVQFQLDNVNYGPVVTVSPYSIVLDSTQLSDGAHFLLALATDSGGATVRSSLVSITVNNSTTAVAITAPAANAAVSGNSVTVTAAATARIGLTIASVQFQVDNVNYGAAVTTSPYSIVLDSTQLSDGIHSLVAIATDSAGTTVVSLPVSITVSNTGPPVSGMALVTGFTAGTPRNNFTGGFGMQFTVGARPLNVTALGRIYIAGSTGTHVVKLVSVSDGVDVPGGSVVIALPSGTAGQFAYVPLASPVTLAPNTAYYLISAETSGGDPFYDLGRVTASSAVSVNSGVVDWPAIGLFPVGPANNSYGPLNLLYQPAGPPPIVAITSPVGGTTVSGSSVPVVAAATAGAGLTVASVQFQVDNVNYGAPATTNPYSVTLDTTKLTNGTHTLTAVATDSASDINTSAPVVVTVSNRATSVSIATPADGSPVSGSRVVVSASATPATGLTIASVQFRLDNAGYGPVVTTSPYSIVLDSTQLSDGTHYLVAIATDSSGATVVSPPVSITVNNSTTTVAITVPVANAAVSGSDVMVMAVATARIGLSISSVQFQVDNVNYGAAVTASPYSIVVNSTQLSDGTHSLVAIAMDSAGTVVASLPVSITVSNGVAPPSGTAMVIGFTAGPPRNDFTGGFGMLFTVGAAPLNVIALGRIYIAGNTGTHIVKLLNSDGSDVPGGSVTISLPSGTAGQFAYVALDNPVTLAPQTAYYLISEETSGGDQFYDLGPVRAGRVSVNSGVVEWPGIGLIPVGPANDSYGPVNLLYTTPI